MVELLSRMMSPISSRIDSTGTLDECMRMTARHDYNLIILDLRLKDSNVEDTLAAIKLIKKRPSAVVVVSGATDEGIEQKVREAGADAFVPKGKDALARSLMIATHVAVMHLPGESKRSDTFQDHVNMLAQMAAA